MKRATRLAATMTWPIVRTVNRLSSERPLTLIGWHRLGSADDGLTTRPRDFRRHLDVLSEWGATVLGLEEAHARLRAGDLPERAVALTFDDGYASVLEQAWPELRARGLPATLFAVSGCLGGAQRRFPWDRDVADADLVRLANADELVEAVGEGLHVGSHTVTHRWLPSLCEREVRDELVRSRADLEDLIGDRVATFAYPMGGLTPTIRDQVAQAGYEVAITCERGANRRHHDSIALRRAFAFDDGHDVRRQLDGAFTWSRRLENRRLAREPRW